MDTRGGTEADVKTRISKAAFHILRNVWKSRVIGKTTTIRLFNTNAKSVLLYGAETWRINKTTLKNAQTFVKQCLRKIFGIYGWTKLATRASGREQTKFKVRYTFLREDGMASPHLEKAKQQHYETGLGVKPSGQGKREGVQNNTWRHDLEADITEMGLSWQQLERIAQGRRRWREVVHGLCFRSSRGPKYVSSDEDSDCRERN